MFSSPHRVGATLCEGKPHDTRLWPDGSLMSCYLEGAQDFQGTRFPDETGLWVYEDGTLASYSLQRGDGPKSATVTFRGSTCTSAEYYPDGSLYTCRTFDEDEPKLNLQCFDPKGKAASWDDCRDHEPSSLFKEWMGRVRKRRR